MSGDNYIYGLDFSADDNEIARRATDININHHVSTHTDCYLHKSEVDKLLLRWSYFKTPGGPKSIFRGFINSRSLEHKLVLALLYTPEEQFLQTMQLHRKYLPLHESVLDYVVIYLLMGAYFTRTSRGLPPNGPAFIKATSVRAPEDYRGVFDKMQEKRSKDKNKKLLEQSVKSEFNRSGEYHCMSYKPGFVVLKYKFKTIKPTYVIVKEPEQQILHVGITYTTGFNSDGQLVFIPKTKRPVVDIITHPLAEEREKGMVPITTAHAMMQTRYGWYGDTRYTCNAKELEQLIPKAKPLVKGEDPTLLQMIMTNDERSKRGRTDRTMMIGSNGWQSEGVSNMSRMMHLRKFSGTKDINEFSRVYKEESGYSVESDINLRQPKFARDLVGKAYILSNKMPEESCYTPELLQRGRVIAEESIISLVARLPLFKHRGEGYPLNASDFMYMDDGLFGFKVIALSHERQKWFLNYYEELTIMVFGMEYATYFALPNVRYQMAALEYDSTLNPVWKGVLNQEHARLSGLPSIFHDANEYCYSYLNYKIKRSHLEIVDDYLRVYYSQLRSRGLVKAKSTVDDWKDCKYQGMRQMLTLFKRKGDSTIKPGSPADSQLKDLTFEYNNDTFLNYEVNYSKKESKKRVRDWDAKEQAKYGKRILETDKELLQRHLFKDDVYCQIPAGANTFCFIPNSEGKVDVLHTPAKESMVRYEDIKMTQWACESVIAEERRKQVKQTTMLVSDWKFRKVPKGLVVPRSHDNLTVRGNGVEIALIKDVEEAKRISRNATAREKRQQLNARIDENAYEIVPQGLEVGWNEKTYVTAEDGSQVLVEVHKTVIGDGRVRAPYQYIHLYKKSQAQAKSQKRKQFQHKLAPYKEKAKEMLYKGSGASTLSCQDKQALDLYQSQGIVENKLAEQVIPRSQIRIERQMTGMRPDDPLTPDTNRLHQRDKDAVIDKMYNQHIIDDQLVEAGQKLMSKSVVRTMDHMQRELAMYNYEKQLEANERKANNNTRFHDVKGQFVIDNKVLVKPTNLRPIRAGYDGDESITDYRERADADNWYLEQKANGVEAINNFYIGGSKMAYSRDGVMHKDAESHLTKHIFTDYSNGTRQDPTDRAILNLTKVSDYEPFGEVVVKPRVSTLKYKPAGSHLPLEPETPKSIPKLIEPGEYTLKKGSRVELVPKDEHIPIRERMPAESERVGNTISEYSVEKVDGIIEKRLMRIINVGYDYEPESSKPPVQYNDDELVRMRNKAFLDEHNAKRIQEEEERERNDPVYMAAYDEFMKDIVFARPEGRGIYNMISVGDDAYKYEDD